MSFDDNVDLGVIIDEGIDELIKLCLGGPGEHGTAFEELNEIRIEFDPRAAIVFRNTGDGQAFIRFIVDAVTIGIRDGATLVPCQSGNPGTLVLFIANAVVVAIRASPK